MAKKFNGEKFTALLYNKERDAWSEAYGYLGSFYQSYASARFEVNFCITKWPEKYDGWAIERIELDDGFQVQSPRVVVLAHSKDAPIWSLAKETAAPATPRTPAGASSLAGARGL